MSSFISQNVTEIEAVTGCIFACICQTVFRMLSCLQINWQPFYLRQLLKFRPFDWLIEIYLQTEGQGTHHKMVSLQPMNGFSSLLLILLIQLSISSKTILPGTRLEGGQPPRDNHCVQKRSSWDKTGSQKPHLRDINLENFTNVSINSDTI